VNSLAVRLLRVMLDTDPLRLAETPMTAMTASGKVAV
jgi:hypothetical protein